jgi:hypothetical protein
MNEDGFARVLRLIDDKELIPYYCKILLINTNDLEFVKLHEIEQKNNKIDVQINDYVNDYINTNADLFNKYCHNNRYKPFGYIPYKLMKSDIIIEQRDDKWREKIEQPIKDFLKLLDDKLIIRNKSIDEQNIIDVPDVLEIIEE